VLVGVNLFEKKVSLNGMEVVVLLFFLCDLHVFDLFHDEGVLGCLCLRKLCLEQVISGVGSSLLGCTAPDLLLLENLVLAHQFFNFLGVHAHVLEILLIGFRLKVVYLVFDALEIYFQLSVLSLQVVCSFVCLLQLVLLFNALPSQLIFYFLFLFSQLGHFFPILFSFSRDLFILESLELEIKIADALLCILKLIGQILIGILQGLNLGL